MAENSKPTFWMMDGDLKININHIVWIKKNRGTGGATIGLSVPLSDGKTNVIEIQRGTGLDRLYTLLDVV